MAEKTIGNSIFFCLKIIPPSPGNGNGGNKGSDFIVFQYFRKNFVIKVIKTKPTLNP